MLCAFMVNLVAAANVPILGPLGRPIGSWFLRQVTRHDPVLGARLHDSDDLRPYTASTLLDERGRPIPTGEWLHSGQEVWARFTTIGREMSEFCRSTLFPACLGISSLYKMPFRILGWTLDPAQHPWAGSSSFQELGPQDEKKLPHQIGLEFASPTAFRMQEADLPLPLPSSVFHSLWQRWNALVPQEMNIDPAWPDFAAACIVVSQLCLLNTEQWKFAEGTRGVTTGFTGIVRFNLLPKHFRPKMAVYWEGADQVMHTLSRFAFYSGIGQKTTVGLARPAPCP